MLFRLILLVTAGVLLIGGAFLWINHINEETRMTEALNDALPIKRSGVKPNLGLTNSATSVTTTTTTNTVTETIGRNLNNLQNSIKDLPNQLLSTSQAKSKVEEETAASKLALNSQSAYALPATTREQALALAKESAGKGDPLAPIEGFRPFPRSGQRIVAKAPGDKAEPPKKSDLIPPPPPGSIPPPPPPILSSQGDTLPLEELPEPPEKPSIARFLKVVGILGDRAFMSVTDQNVRRSNHLPKILVVSAGDRFDYLSIIDVTDSSVTLEENGERLVKHLSVLR